LAGITVMLLIRPEEVTYFDRKDKGKKTASIRAPSLELEGDDIRKLINVLCHNPELPYQQ